MDPAGNAISLTQTPAEAANTLNCTLIAPNHPLTARGLATPWQLSDGCSEANPAEEAFVESTILAPNGRLQIYDPLVITQGSTPAATPTPPRIPRGSQVIINVGFNGNNLALEGRGAYQGNCLDAFGNSVIAQTSACNARSFFRDANFQIAIGRLRIPRRGCRLRLQRRWPRCWLGRTWFGCMMCGRWWRRCGWRMRFWRRGRCGTQVASSEFRHA